MATSIRAELLARNENERVSQKRPPRSVTIPRGEGGRLAKLWELIKPSASPLQDVQNADFSTRRRADSVQRIPALWSDVINDPVLWKELREVVLDNDDNVA